MNEGVRLVGTTGWLGLLAQAALLILAVTLMPAPTRAQPGGDGDRAQARRLFEEGVQALDDQRYADAADLFSRSLAIRESPIARFDRALALRGAGRYVEALADLAVLGEQSLDEALTAQVDRMHGELEASVARLALDVTGRPDRVQVGEQVFEHPEPHMVVTLDPGEVRIRLEREGYEPVDRVVTLAAGERRHETMRADVFPIPAHLIIEASPSDAEIRWHDRVLGQGRARVEENLREEMTFELVVSVDGYETERRHVTLGPGSRERITLSLSSLEETPLRRKWWLWTIVTVAAAGLATGLGLGLREDFQVQTGSFDFAQEVLMRTPR